MFYTGIVTHPRDPNHSPATLFELALIGHPVCLACPVCGHRRVFDPYAIWWLFERRGWSDRLADVPKRFVCTKCVIARRRVRPLLTIEPTSPPTDDTLERPSEQEWKRVISRQRS